MTGMVGAGDASAVRPRDTSIRMGQIEGHASRAAEEPEQGTDGKRKGRDIWVFFLVVW